jgi:2'-5' RNA ligase
VSQDRARLFVALELPEEVRDALVGWRAAALARRDGIRLIAAEDLHATLCFLGWQPEAAIGEIFEACRAGAAQAPPELSLGDALGLPRRRPRVVAVGLRDLRGRLAELQGTVSAALQAGGWYRPEQRRFLGHVTVARAGRSTSFSAPALAGAPPPPSLCFRAERVTLYRSRLHRSGARYEALHRIELPSAV